MENRIITIESQTAAIKASRLLASGGIPAKATKLRPGQSRRGCTHGVRVSVYDIDRACAMLSSAGINYTGVVSP